MAFCGGVGLLCLGHLLVVDGIQSIRLNSQWLWIYCLHLWVGHILNEESLFEKHITCLDIVLRLLANGIQAGTFTVANLYYNHPILNILADEFDVSYEKVSAIPTVMQAGYAAGLLLLNPLGDIFRRRAFVLILVWFTATVVSLHALSLLIPYLNTLSGLAYVLRDLFLYSLPSPS